MFTTEFNSCVQIKIITESLFVMSLCKMSSLLTSIRSAFLVATRYIFTFDEVCSSLAQINIFNRILYFKRQSANKLIRLDIFNGNVCMDVTISLLLLMAFSVSVFRTQQCACTKKIRFIAKTKRRREKERKKKN